MYVKGQAVRNTHRPSRPGQIPETAVDAQKFSAWHGQVLALLVSALGADHVYAAKWRDEVKRNRITDTDIGLGILQAAREDFEGGYLFDLRQLLVAEVFADFLDMANHLHESNYHHAAASLAGAVLEDALRRFAGTKGLKATGNLESLNQVMLDGKLYDRLAYNQVKVWTHLRNLADHGEFQKVHRDDVAAMLRDVPGFLSRHLT
jgi:hypothetical protein